MKKQNRVLTIDACGQALSKKSTILDYLWQYPANVNLLNIVDLVSVSYPPVSGLSAPPY